MYKWYNCIDLLWDFIKALNRWSHHRIRNDGTRGHWCFCWWSSVLLWCPPPPKPTHSHPPPLPFEEPEGRAYCIAGVSVCQSIISFRSFSSEFAPTRNEIWYTDLSSRYLDEVWFEYHQKIINKIISFKFKLWKIQLFAMSVQFSS